MNVYIVKSGDMEYRHQTAGHADAKAVALIALEPASTTDMARRLGLLTSVNGGRYKGDNEVFFSTENLLADLGRF